MNEKTESLIFAVESELEIARKTLSKDNFGYAEMLKIQTPFWAADKTLDNLAEFMAKQRGQSDSEIPAGYTYLSQFVDHDITFDSTSDTLPWGKIDSSTVINKRTPLLDLETVYGFENPSNSDEVSRNHLLQTKSLLKLGDTIGDNTGSVKKPFPNDLPRMPDSSRAEIVDARNDENLAIAQTQVAFIKFHNAIVSHLGGADSTALFEEARRIAIRHYQWIILYDFLPKFIKKTVLADVLANGNKFYFPDSEKPFMPLEFSVAAYRMGHSMVRSAYQWNRIFNNDENSIHSTLDQLMLFTGRGGMSGKKSLPSAWAINWNWFYNIDGSTRETGRFNYARKIDTLISPPLGFLSPTPVFVFKRENSLPALDLYRTRAFGLPTGQAVACKIQEKIPGVGILNSQQITQLLPENLKNVFSDETPLWFYILAEAEINENGKTLGDVGSRIVAETFVALLKASPFSILTEPLQSNDEFLGTDGKFGMPEMLKFIASKNGEFDEFNPLGA